MMMIKSGLGGVIVDLLSKKVPIVVDIKSIERVEWVNAEEVVDAVSALNFNDFIKLGLFVEITEEDIENIFKVAKARK